jgi:hypothetical protein
LDEAEVANSLEDLEPKVLHEMLLEEGLCGRVREDPDPPLVEDEE